MLSLESAEWENLRHAYGPATDIPDLLQQLEAFPSDNGRSEPWSSIWSALAHQGDVYRVFRSRSARRQVPFIYTDEGVILVFLLFLPG